MLYWFHAFRRDSCTDAIQALRSGFTPRTGSNSRQLELDLNLTAHVYCYLGRTKETFGDFAVVLHKIGSEGAAISPFDTGGLVNYCEPVCHWSEEERNHYLASYTWDVSEIDRCVVQYPGDDIGTYLDTSKSPGHDGPHKIWPERPVADIWLLSDDWRAWTWECRIPERLITNHIVAWTCSPSNLLDILRYQESTNDDVTAAWLTNMLDKFIEGGVGILVQQMKEYQIR